MVLMKWKDSDEADMVLAKEKKTKAGQASRSSQFSGLRPLPQAVVHKMTSLCVCVCVCVW